ncbi:MAG: SRPBCC domain-containing protein, partial [Pseudonocardia sp.]|nr:SRPBCC domain-containing protein [Pseudonocardia sp.]
MTIGKTRDAGWQVGASRTLGHPLDRVWTALVESPELWLGPGAALPLEAGQAWTAGDGACGELRS